MALVSKKARGRRVAITVILLAFIARRNRHITPSGRATGQVLHATGHSKRARRRKQPGKMAVAVVLISVTAMALAIYAGYQLTRLPSIPPEPGAVLLLEPGNPVYPSNALSLDMEMAKPSATYVEYGVAAGCNNTAKEVDLVLSGDARIRNYKPSYGSGLTPKEQTVRELQPWFAPGVHVEIFHIPLTPRKCPAGVTPSQLQVGMRIGGTINRSFERSAGASYALQLPTVGDDQNLDLITPSLGGSWAVPLDPSVQVFAGDLPLNDRVDVAHPALDSSGGLEWSGKSFVHSSATWTDTTSSGREQFDIFALGAVIGIFGAIIATVVLDWARGRAKKADGTT
jgi:hypothetical protein